MQPLSPPVFNKIATHSKNLRFFILFVFGFACFQPVVIFVDFQIPLGTQLVQNGMKMVPNTDPLGCFLIQFRPTLPKKTQPTTPRTFSFVTLAPKPDFHLHCDQPQHETHNLQHTLSEWICGCFGIPLKNQCLRMLFLYSTQGSDKICQKPSEIYITKLHSTHLPFCKTSATAFARAQLSKRMLSVFSS